MENPQILLGVPLLVLGGIGALVAIAALIGPVHISSWWFEPMGGARQVPARPLPATHAPAERRHPTAAIYLRVGVAMAIVDGLELAAYYAGSLGGSYLGWLMLLTAIQFGLIALWYMHLRFDSRVLSGLLVGGLLLAISVFIVVLAAFGASLT
jgi:cytochrome c oxidase subunit 4